MGLGEVNRRFHFGNVSARANVRPLVRGTGELLALCCSNKACREALTTVTTTNIVLTMPQALFPKLYYVI